ncbi:MAG: hypothetical protein G01um10145_903 [Microgenomates group bacterium Gr01-1014_5]|nr:MAG: hypothetical protein G01um10145_903 [Microgenomates group bacterium Gr01-1014_5]
MTSIYQDFAFRVLDWANNIWTESAKQIVDERMPHLRAFIAEYKKEAEFMTGAFQQIFGETKQ